jgi:hypothetical protein
MLHATYTATAVNQANIQRVDELIWKDRHISMCEVAEEVNMIVDSVEAIICNKLKFSNVSAKWVPQQFLKKQTEKCAEVRTQLLQHFQKDDKDFLSLITACDETWVYHYIPENKHASMEWQQSNLSPPKKFEKTMVSRVGNGYCVLICRWSCLCSLSVRRSPLL